MSWYAVTLLSFALRARPLSMPGPSMTYPAIGFPPRGIRGVNHEMYASLLVAETRGFRGGCGLTLHGSPRWILSSISDASKPTLVAPVRLPHEFIAVTFTTSADTQSRNGNSIVAAVCVVDPC